MDIANNKPRVLEGRSLSFYRKIGGLSIRTSHYSLLPWANQGPRSPKIPSTKTGFDLRFATSVDQTNVTKPMYTHFNFRTWNNTLVPHVRRLHCQQSFKSKLQAPDMAAQLLSDLSIGFFATSQLGSSFHQALAAYESPRPSSNSWCPIRLWVVYRLASHGYLYTIDS